MILLLPLVGCGVTQVLDAADDGTPILIRTPQPDAEDLEDLQDEFGVRTVLNLRGERPGSDWFEEERAGVEAIGADWRHIKLSGSRAPSDEQVETFFGLVEDPKAWPVVLHCLGGVHRTGLFSALYRMQYQGWTGDEAVAEMEDHWFDWTVRDRDAVKAYLRAYQPDPARTLDRGAGRPASSSGQQAPP